MRKLLIVVAVMSIFMSCNRKSDKLKLAIQDSLENVVRMKDSIINETFININDIAASLNQIAEREKLISKQAAGELNKTTRAQIADNLAAISQLLEENRKRIEGLQASADKLKKANIQIDGLQALVASLQEQQAEKNVQIESLTQQVKALNIQVADLKTSVQTLRDDKDELEHEVAARTEELNTVYYIVGNEKSLLSKGIIDKKGVIGRTRVVGTNADLSDFTKADKRTTERITVGGKKARIVSSHPENSYMLIMGDRNTLEELVITDKEAFWKNSNILIISHR